MNPRLDELLRQRQLLVEHLAWLDEEIAKVSYPSEEPIYRPIPSAVTSRPPVSAAEAAPEPPVVAQTDTSATEQVAASIIEQYQDQNKRSLSSAKRSVYLIFAALLGIFLACLLAFYFYEKMRLGR